MSDHHFHLHFHHAPGNEAPTWAVELKALMEKNMSAITDLTAEVVELKQAVADEIADIEAVLSKLQGQTDDPAVVQAVADIRASLDTMKAEHAKVNPPPAPAQRA